MSLPPSCEAMNADVVMGTAGQSMVQDLMRSVRTNALMDQSAVEDTSEMLSTLQVRIYCLLLKTTSEGIRIELAPGE